MLETWQDVVVTAVALGAFWVVVTRSLGAWRTSAPSQPACDHCVIKREVEGLPPPRS